MAPKVRPATVRDTLMAEEVKKEQRMKKNPGLYSKAFRFSIKRALEAIVDVKLQAEIQKITNDREEMLPFQISLDTVESHLKELYYYQA